MPPRPAKAKVATPFGLHSVPGPSADVVDLLETLLAQAKRGEIVGIAATVINPAKYTMSKWASDGPVGNNDLIAGIAWLQNDYLMTQREEDQS